MKMRLNVSARYLVLGGYKDRTNPIVRLYIPFVRLSLYFGKGSSDAE